MRPEHDDSPIIPELITDSAAAALILQLSVLAVVAALVMMLAPETPWSLRLMVTALVLLTIRRWGGVLVLILVQADLLLREGRAFRALTGASGVIWVFTVLIVLMLAARNRQLLVRFAGESAIHLTKRLLQPQDLDLSDDPPQKKKLHLMTRICISAAYGLILLLSCVLVSRALLNLIPSNRQLTATLREYLSFDATQSGAVFILVLVVTVWLVASEMHWRQLTVSQAGMYLRSDVILSLYRDLRMIVVRRLRERQKRFATARERPEKSTGQ